MKRFFGMMPRSEVKREEHFVDALELEITIQAGPHGWTILYADHSSEYEDADDTTDNNFNKAYLIAKSNLGELIKLNEQVPMFGAES